MRGRGIKYLVEGWVRQRVEKNERRGSEREREGERDEGEGNKVFSHSYFF